MTNEEYRRVYLAIDETKRLLMKEMRYAPDLRKPELLERYQRHIAKLEHSIATGIAPTMGAAQ